MQDIETPLIRCQVTADRGAGILVTTQDVLECIQSLPTETFTTRDIADAIKAAHPHDAYHRLEYACRQSVTWLIVRGHVARSKRTVKRYTKAGEPYPATVYMYVERGGDCDCDLLNQIFLGVRA